MGARRSLLLSTWATLAGYMAVVVGARSTAAAWAFTAAGLTLLGRLIQTRSTV